MFIRGMWEIEETGQLFSPLTSARALFLCLFDSNGLNEISEGIQLGDLNGRQKEKCSPN